MVRGLEGGVGGRDMGLDMLVEGKLLGVVVLEEGWRYIVLGKGVPMGSEALGGLWWRS